MRIFFSGLLCVFAGYVFSEPVDTAAIAKISDQWNPLPQVKTYNPYISGVASLILPGAGQIYTHQYLKSGTFFVSQAITGYLAYWWNSEMRNRQRVANRINDSAGTILNVAFYAMVREDSQASALLLSGAGCRQRAQLQHFTAVEAQMRSINALTWAVGVYVYNIFDAVGCSNVFLDNKERSPLIAGWLAAIPVLGLGQLYNGSIGKAGMIMMGQGALGVVAWNYYRLLRVAEDEYKNLKTNSGNAGTIDKTLSDQYSDQWRFSRDNAFQNWNQYMWYSIAFYFYSIFDAVVDAHLHDYPVKMKIEPDLSPKGGVSMKLNMDF
jgi:hypothetical protein